MSEKSLKPEIRFAGFTENWEQHKAGEIFLTTTDKNHPELPVLSASQEYGMIKRDEAGINIYHDKRNETTYKRVLPGQFVIHLRSFQGGFAHSTIEGITSPAYTVLDFIEREKNYDFFWKYILNSELFVKRLETVTYGIRDGRSISYEDFTAMKFSYPDYDEQHKIGLFFKRLDNLITLHQRKCEKLVNFKKAMLEKMFPKDGTDMPEIRFAGFAGAWERRKLDEQVLFYSGLTYSPSDVVEGHGTLVLRSSNVHGGEIVNADNVYVSSKAVNSDNVQVGDIVVVVRNGSKSLIGKHAQIKETMNNTVIGAFMTGIRYKQADFINALLSTPQFYSEIKKNLGATINQITTGTFREMQFHFPNTVEQKYIGDFFRHLDHLITLHQQELEKLKNIKKSLLGKMFV